MTSRAASQGPRGPRSRLAWALMALASVAGVVVLLGLGIWQVQRLAWKTDLIARVEARLDAEAVPAPGPSSWSLINASADEYRRVSLAGNYLFEDEVLVKAVTGQGSGFWVMTPLVTADGWAAWINRGFVPDDRRSVDDRVSPEGTQELSGLLRITQPGGAFLRANDPAGKRWYSRDVEALSATFGVSDHAPYFIDADRGDDASALPLGGLTVVSFRNNHLSYALTWFAMAAGLAAGAWYVLSRDRSQE
ncbi:SURF1 family protein [Paracoccus sp. MBLB3053]|uniref:SURF1-like protein n=1 Tax=Paracoccus aurantius TaxID=3073814 RepID=A0ABU2HVN0_9RHOB|nr:SURF1 family protein [Paracoccus sp. MBLB3053]MDS9469103.1 SURF1 family protein [Paracoccus sp. MBLB3053]